MNPPRRRLIDLRGRDNLTASYCREYMICPLPRASDLSASERGGAVGDYSRGGCDAVSARRLGAGDAGPRSDSEGAERRDSLVSGGRDSGDAPAQRATLAA